MSLTRIPSAIREQVRLRADGRCEYCLLAEEHAHFSHEIDHIIAEKHGGEATLENLALSCFDCNRFKGSVITSVDPVSGEIVSLFNPRSQLWGEHFSDFAWRNRSAHCNWSRNGQITEVQFACSRRSS